MSQKKRVGDAVDPRGFHQLIRQRHKELAEQESSGRRGHQRQR